MRKEAKAIAVELAKLELQLRPLLAQRDELRNALRGKLPIGEPEVVDGYLFHKYEATEVSFDEVELLKTLGDRANLITVPKLDSEKLDSALRLGLVKSEELEPFTHVRVTVRLLVRESNHADGRKANNGKRTNNHRR